MDAAAEDMFVPVERALAGSTLADFEVRRKIGGKDIMPGGLQQTVTQHGVCSYVYEVVSTRPAAAASGAFALKVMINMQGEQTMDLQDAYRSEYELLADARKLPRHPNITCVLHHFNDLATPDRLPGFDFDPQDVAARTTFLVLPLCDGGDLRALMKRRFQAGQHFSEAEVRSLFAEQLCSAVAHLQLHGIAHRDIKADNLMLRRRGEGREPQLVLIDFGVCMNFREYGLDGFKLPFSFPCPRGGAPGFLAPEIVTPRPGPGRFLDYAKNDDWACGFLLHAMLCGPAATPPFSCGEDPRCFQDEHYTPPPELRTADGGGGFAPVFREVCHGA
jgi:serine/threonine protein kinase